MPDKSVRESATTVIGRILEGAAFIFTDRLEAAQKPSLDSWRPEGVSLKFHGESSGELHMWAGEEFARLAAANMLGMDAGEEDAARKGMDALKEILNMVVGNFLPAYYGESPVFDLAIPEQMEASSLAKDAGDPDAVWLQAEEHPVLFVIRIAP